VYIRLFLPEILLKRLQKDSQYQSIPKDLYLLVLHNSLQQQLNVKALNVHKEFFEPLSVMTTPFSTDNIKGSNLGGTVSQGKLTRVVHRVNLTSVSYSHSLRWHHKGLQKKLSSIRKWLEFRSMSKQAKQALTEHTYILQKILPASTLRPIRQETPWKVYKYEINPALHYQT